MDNDAMVLLGGAVTVMSCATREAYERGSGVFSAHFAANRPPSARDVLVAALELRVNASVKSVTIARKEGDLSAIYPPVAEKCW